MVPPVDVDVGGCINDSKWGLFARCLFACFAFFDADRGGLGALETRGLSLTAAAGEGRGRAEEIDARCRSVELANPMLNFLVLRTLFINFYSVLVISEPFPVLPSICETTIPTRGPCKTVCLQS